MFEDFDLMNNLMPEEAGSNLETNDYIDDVTVSNSFFTPSEDSEITDSYNLIEQDKSFGDVNSINEFDSNYHGKSEISFGNMYDDRAAKFINDCEANGVDLPSSIDRSSNGGLTSIDKSIIGGKLDSLHQSGAISDSTYNDLKGRLWSC